MPPFLLHLGLALLLQQPDSKQALLLRIQSLTSLHQHTELAAAAQQLHAIDPLDVTALYWLTRLAPHLDNYPPGWLDSATSAATALVNDGATIFSTARRPESSTPEQWQKARGEMETLGLKTLAWLHLQRRENDQTEALLRQYSARTPDDGEAAYWLYLALVNMMRPERSADALFYLARAANLPESTGGINGAFRQELATRLKKTYDKYHGPDEPGLVDLRTLALSRPHPPEGFAIETRSVRDERRLAAARRENPQLAFWRDLRVNLDTPDGDRFFLDRLKGAILPGRIEATDIITLKGKLATCTPPLNPTQLTLILDGAAEEVLLKLSAPLPGKPTPGTVLEFQGIPTHFTRQPFQLTIQSDPEQLTGWPRLTPAPAKK